ncbi:MAG TPA: DUF4266 domain-containing protein [Pseudomonadales bacterium]
MKFVSRVLALAFTLGVLGGCGSMELEPWVSPYERNNLADPIMSFARAPVASAYMHHVHQAREGARGAEGGAGGGCGCN